MSSNPDKPDDLGIRIVNEFAEAVVSKVAHGNGARLRVRAPKTGAEAVIDAVVLEAIAAVPTEDLTAILVATVPGNAPHLLEHLQQNRSS